MEKTEVKNPEHKCDHKKTNFWDFAKSHPFVTFFSVATVTNGAVAIVHMLTKK